MGPYGQNPFTVLDIDGDGQKDLVAEFTNGKTSLYQSKVGSWTTLIDPAWGLVMSQSTYLPRGDHETADRIDIQSTLHLPAGTNYTQIGTMADQPKTENVLKGL